MFLFNHNCVYCTEIEVNLKLGEIFDSNEKTKITWDKNNRVYKNVYCIIKSSFFFFQILSRDFGQCRTVSGYDEQTAASRFDC